MNNREEFEIIKGFGQRKWDYDKMENYLKENKFFREIWAVCPCKCKGEKNDI